MAVETLTIKLDISATLETLAKASATFAGLIAERNAADVERWHRVAMEAGAVTHADGSTSYPRREEIARLNATFAEFEDKAVTRIGDLERVLDATREVIPSWAGNTLHMISKVLGEDPDAPPPVMTFQDGVAVWLKACFAPEVVADEVERGDRLLEEIFELLQSGDYPRERIRALEKYVYDRPKGYINQEVGGAMVTFAAYCHTRGIDMHDEGNIELDRISAPETMAKIRAKQAAKPTGSALPIAMPEVVPIDGPEVLDSSGPGDQRPTNCRFRLIDEGKGYPKGGCDGCGKTAFKGLGNSCSGPFKVAS